VSNTELSNVSNVVESLEEKQSEIESILDKVVNRSYSVESLNESELTQVRALVSNTELTNVSHVVESLEEKRSEIESILDKVVNRSYTLESLNESEVAQVRALVRDTELTNISHVVESLEEKRSEIESILDKFENKSYTLESLNESEIAQIKDLMSDTELTNVTHVVESLEEKCSEIELILDKVVNKSYTIESLNESEIAQVRALVSDTELTNVTHVVESLESLSESETAHLLDFINTIHLENTRKTSRDVEQISTEKLMDRAFESASFKRVDRTIAKLKNISILDDTTINRISKFERHARPLKVLVVEDFPNYLRETPLQYYTLIPHANVVNATNVTNQLRATTQSTMSHKVDTVTNSENQQRDENIDSLLRKVEEQSRKIERLEKTSSTDSSYRLSQSDINAITDDLLYKLENQSSIENFRKGIF
jgi:hypothetical protein